MQEIKNISSYRQSLKDKILETSMSLFAERGIRAVKMDDIATRLSISKRTLYELYEDKESLLFEGIKKFHMQRREHMHDIADQSDNVMDIILETYKMQVEEFRLTNPTFYSDLERYPRVLRYLQEENRSSHSQFIDFLHRGVAEGHFRNDINYELIAHMFGALGKYIMSNSLYKHYSMEQIFLNLVFVSLRGFCTPKGVDTLDKFLADSIEAGRGQTD